MKGHECQVKRTWKEHEGTLKEHIQNERNIKGNEYDMKSTRKEHGSKMKGTWKGNMTFVLSHF